MDRRRCLCLVIWVLLVASEILMTVSAQTSTINQTSASNTITPKKRRRLKQERAHGWLLWASMNFLMPLGTIVVRMTKSEIEKGSSGRRIEILVYSHIVMQVLAVLLSVAGGAISLQYFGDKFRRTHHRLGLALYAMAWLMPITGFLRPKRGVSWRPIWYALHWLFGTGAIVLGFINSYIGLTIYERHAKRSQRTVNILLSIQIGFMGLIYLFQDRWGYTKRQGPRGKSMKPAAQELSHEKGQVAHYPGSPFPNAAQSV